MVDLTDDQKVAIEIELIRLQAKNVITDDQLGAITRALFNIEWTVEDEEYERRATTPKANDQDVKRATA
jgi:hypothetical protein